MGRRGRRVERWRRLSRSLQTSTDGPKPTRNNAGDVKAVTCSCMHKRAQRRQLVKKRRDQNILVTVSGFRQLSVDLKFQTSQTSDHFLTLSSACWPVDQPVPRHPDRGQLRHSYITPRKSTPNRLAELNIASSIRPLRQERPRRTTVQVELPRRAARHRMSDTNSLKLGENSRELCNMLYKSLNH